ncbi:DUF63 family protein [Methanoregula sp.]|uniref:DUF63 family protein n=1 Tax=Methanoregula sp. TaxID=2052170 RepID=UPI000CAAF8D8|nr:DUF63 family protein [Methanoregula sp.]PKG31669.1 MAG: hypothetical protein CW742_12190 [Methanoregula sp.]
MVSDFIYKYYIDPITQGEAYNIVDTLTYALILVAGVYLLYRWLTTSTWLTDIGFKIDQGFILATLPYVVLGGVMRVIEDTGMIEGSFRFLLITPLIYFVLFAFTVTMMFASLYLAKQGIGGSFNTLYAGAGTFALMVASLLLVAWSMSHNGINFFILILIPFMALASTAAVWAFMRYVLSWTYVTDPLYITLLFGQLLDASATSYGIDLHPSVQYVEQHVVGSALIDATGTAFVMYPLKLVVLFPSIYVMELYRKEANTAFWHLVLLAMIVVGFAPGIRGMIRMVLHV